MNFARIFCRLGVEQKEANHDQGVDGCESWLPRFELPDTVLATHDGAIQGLFLETNPPVLAGPVLQRRADFLHNYHHDLVWIHFLEHGMKRATQQNVQNVMGELKLPYYFWASTMLRVCKLIYFVEISVLYRKQGAGMYAPLPYALAQALTEIPYVSCKQ